MPTPPTARNAIEALGENAILERIQSGVSMTEIANELGCNVGSLSRWLHADPQRSARATSVMTESAESWLDRGLQALTEAASDNAEIQRARAIEQHCARRAAVRNPLYRDKVDVSLSQRKPGDYSGMSDAELEALAQQHRLSHTPPP